MQLLVKLVVDAHELFQDPEEVAGVLLLSFLRFGAGAVPYE